MLVGSQSFELLLRICGDNQRLLGLASKIFAAFEIGKALVLCEAFEVVGIPQQNFGQKLAVDEQLDEDFDGSRVVCQKPQRCGGIWNGVNKAFQIQDRAVRIRGLRQSCQEHRQRVCERSSSCIVTAKSEQSVVCELPVRKADWCQQTFDVGVEDVFLKELVRFARHAMKYCGDEMCFYVRPTAARSLAGCLKRGRVHRFPVLCLLDRGPSIYGTLINANLH